MKIKQVLIVLTNYTFITFCIFYACSASTNSILEFVPNEVIVQYRNSAGSNNRLAHKSTMRLALRQVILREGKRSNGKGELAVVKLSAPVNSVKQLAQTIQKIQQDPDVEYAEPNWILHKLGTNLGIKNRSINISAPHFPNDKYFRDGESWGMYGSNSFPDNPFGTRASEVWFGLSTPLNCSDVYIGIVDEGIMPTHPDLRESIWVNRNDPVDGKDNDGNGYIDDRNGWDFYHNDRTIYHRNEDYHGTHIAGIIAAAGDNDIGIAGVCWKAKLISTKFLGPGGGTIANAIKAIDYLTDLKIRHGLNIVATNNSWGGGGYSQALVEAIQRAETQNILFIAAAGNDGADNDTNPFYPASYANANIISVAALNSKGQLSSFSNYGYHSVDLAAPGEDIISAIPDYEGKPAYGYYSGTSMATAFVTGAIALLAHKHKTSNAQRIKQAILKGAMPTNNLYGMTTTGGRLDIPETLQSDLIDLLENIYQDIKRGIDQF